MPLWWKINLTRISYYSGFLAKQDFLISKAKESGSAISDNYVFTLNWVTHVTFLWWILRPFGWSPCVLMEASETSSRQQKRRHMQHILIRFCCHLGWDLVLIYPLQVEKWVLKANEGILIKIYKHSKIK